MKRSVFLVASLVFVSAVLAQPRPQTSPGVGNAVLLATNSIQIDQAAVVVSGDVIVNNATSGPFLGELALSLDNAVSTPAGYKLAATSIDLDKNAVAGGDVYYNTLSNQGTIAGAQFTPLALPVFATLPPAHVRPPGTSNVAVPNGGERKLDEGAYGNLTIGNAATVHLTGGGYAFTSITIGNGASLRFAAPTDIVVSGRVDFGNASFVGPENGSPLTAAAMRIQVDGINGTSGAMTATPPAVHVAQAGKVFANIDSRAGTIVMDQAVEGTGAFLARDIRVKQAVRLALSSAFNLAPTANPQTVFTSGSSPLPIVLSGSDPEGGSLTFTIVSGPGAGTLSAPLQVSPASANVTYTPNAANAPDSFTFRVRDQGGATGVAVVTINPSLTEQPPPNPTTVVATESSAQTTKEVPATLLLRGAAPSGVALTFSIVSGTGPFHGVLGIVTQGSEVPQRSATVVYTPDAGFTGADSFQFQACGVINGATVCGTAQFSINVQPALADTPNVIAHDVAVSTPADTAVVIALGESSILTTPGRRLVIKPQAASTHPVQIAGNVADANGDGLGDNANALPGSAPVFMSAGVNQSGGGGSNGTVRMQFEWDLSTITGNVVNAQVLLPTHRGSVDSLDTFFYWVAASGDGNLTNSDFEAPAEPISGAVMPVPSTMQIGETGTFAFDVVDQLRAAMQGGFSFFAIQGRVNENSGGPARGLEVRTSASGNVTSNDVPMLAVATPGVTAALVYRVTSLPNGGLLRDSSNAAITTVPYDLPSPQVSYEPNIGFLGLASFSFDVSNGVIISPAVARIRVVALDCTADPRGCDNGR